MEHFKLRPIFNADKDTDALRVPCPTCGAQVGSRCELLTGLPRTGPHVARRIDAQYADTEEEDEA